MPEYTLYTIADSYGIRLENHNMFYEQYYDNEEQADYHATNLTTTYGTTRVVHGYKIVDAETLKTHLADTQIFYQTHEDAMDDLKNYMQGKRLTPRLRPEVIDIIRQQFPVGSRVECIKMNDPYTLITKGTQGHVASVDDIGTIHVMWDTGPYLGLVFGEDKYKIVR